MKTGVVSRAYMLTDYFFELIVNSEETIELAGETLAAQVNAPAYSSFSETKSIT